MAAVNFSLLNLGTPAFPVSRARHPSPNSRSLSLTVHCQKTKLAEATITTEKLPPGPMKLPFIGNLHNLLGKPLHHHALRDLAMEYGPLLHLQLGEVSTIIVSSAEMAQKVLKIHDSVFANRPESLSSKILTFDALDIAFSNGTYWKQMRNICMNELLSRRRVQSFASLRDAEVSSLLDSIRLSGGAPVNFTEKLFALMNNITCKAAFGRGFKEQDKVMMVIKEASEVAANFHLNDVFPSLKFIPVVTGLTARLENLASQMDKMMGGIIEEHKEKLRTNNRESDVDAGEDLIDILLKLQDRDTLQCPIASQNIQAVIFDLFAAGTDTSSTTIVWAMTHLMKDPRAMKKTQDEIRQAMKGKPTVEEEDIHQFKYMKSVIKETLRLHPSVPLLLPRESRGVCEIDGYVIPDKTRVLVNAWAIGRDPKHWPDPESFIPERFDDRTDDFKGIHFDYIPFGAGRRICPGMTFGLANIELPLARLLYHFDWKLPDGVTPHNLGLDETFGATVSRKEDLYLSATPYMPFRDNNGSTQLMKMKATQVLE